MKRFTALANLAAPSLIPEPARPPSPAARRHEAYSEYFHGYTHGSPPTADVRFVMKDGLIYRHEEQAGRMRP